MNIIKLNINFEKFQNFKISISNKIYKFYL